MPAWWRRGSLRVRLAALTIAVVALGWPVTASLDLLGFPVFRQVMIGLSWLAPLLTSVDILITAQVHERQGDNRP